MITNILKGSEAQNLWTSIYSVNGGNYSTTPNVDLTTNKIVGATSICKSGAVSNLVGKDFLTYFKEPLSSLSQSATVDKIYVIGR